MKLSRLVMAFLLVIVALSCFWIFTQAKYVGSGEFRDFGAFKKARLKLPEKNESICLVAVGDIMLSRYVSQKIKEHDDPGYPFTEVEWFLRSGDIAFGNLEGPITPGRQIKVPEMVFRADPCMALALKEAGFNMLSLANNHIPDFGRQGILDTIQYLDGAEIKYVGAGRNEGEAYAPKYLQVKGVKLAFLAFNDPAVVPDSYRAGDGPGTAVLDHEKMITAIKEAAINSDFTVVSLHAGTEYTFEPDHIQVRFARLAIDAGADLVLGSHPHVVQKVERYNDKYILYSLGNFIFDQLWSQETREGVVAKICISKNCVIQIEFLPVYINDDARPVFLSGQKGRMLLQKLGIELDVNLVPTWDNEINAFAEREQYVLKGQRDSLEYRLIQNQQLDLDGDGISEEYALLDGKITVREDDSIIWQSPEDWWVDYFFIGDINNDGVSELNLSVWRKGSFGPYRPFWVEEEDTSIKNHLFIFKLEKSTFKPVWQSSNLDHPNYRGALVDLNDDGENELLVTQGCYSDPRTRGVTLWKWNGWGFSRIILDGGE